MSSIEDLVYDAHTHGQRNQLLSKVSEIRNKYPYMPLEKVYDKAYNIIMKTG
jgi:hypothetical protein